MSDKDLFWFHCGRCGSLFQSKAGDIPDRLCSKCGFDPGTGVQDSSQTIPNSIPARKPDADTSSSSFPHRGKRSGKRRKNRHFMLKLVGGWTLLLAMIVFGVNHLFHKDQGNSGPAVVMESSPSDAPSQEDIALLNEAGPKSIENFSGYLNAITTEERNQFVLNPVATAARMDRFYSLNPLTNIDPAAVSLTERCVLHLPGENAIATLWNIKDGRIVEAVFRRENGEWRLDWDQYARYSDYPWALFLAGSGEPEGEFRLLARERLAEMRKDQDTISIVLYAPRFGMPKEVGIQSPEFLVPRNSTNGRRLDAAFKLARAGKRVYDSKLHETNPDGMIRVRVKIKRSEVDMQRSFELTEVTACHWYSVSDPGVVVEKAE